MAIGLKGDPAGGKGYIQVDGVDCVEIGQQYLKLPIGTTAQRPASPTDGMLRKNSTTGAMEVYDTTNAKWTGVGLLDGSTPGTAAPSASYIKQINPTAPDGIYYLNFAAGSAQPFAAYIIFSKSDGPWVKAVQWYGGADLSGTAGVNVGGAWSTAQINAAAGKLHSADINVLKTSQTQLWRCGGGGDNLFNNGAGAMKVTSSYLPNWGVDWDPVVNDWYQFELDMNNNGTYQYGYRYYGTTTGRCGHTTSIWFTDHNSPVGAGSYAVGSLPPYSTMAQCWTVGATGMYTNLHPWSGLSTSSGGSISWGTAAGAQFAIFFKN